MRGEREMDTPTYLCTEQHFKHALDYAIHAETAATFAKRMAKWRPFFPDMNAAIERMTETEYPKFIRGFQMERDKIFSGPEWVARYGCIILPERAIRASLMCRQLDVPWGAMVIRLTEKHL